MNIFFKKISNTPKKESLIILHGLFGSSSNWMSLSKQYANYFDVYVLDARNHGRSFNSEVFNYRAMSEDVFDVLQNQGLNKVHLMGHSMGGKTAMEFASRYEQYISKLIIADIGPKQYPQHHSHIIEALYALDLTKLKTREEAITNLMKLLPDRALVTFLLQNIYRDSEKKFAWRIYLDAISNNIKEVGKALDSKLKIEVPVMFLSGGNSKYIEDSDKQRIKEQFINATFDKIPRAGHWLHAENPKLFLEKTIAYLEQ